ncbi:MAG: F0F1 ATP synthase subunit delta [Candidatus Omnitrophica bacterium]|nr:F0F1 ATP synthase subunit delta [Candidatus Omnitrophota bacterium]
MMTIFLGFLVLTIIVFIALVYFFKKITTENTEVNLRRVAAVYEDLLKKQKDLSEKLAVGEQELQAKRDEAASVVDKLTAQAMDEAHKKEAETLKKARLEAEEILAKAHASRDSYVQDLRVEVSNKVIDWVSDLLSTALDEESRVLFHHQFVKKFMEQAEKSDLAAVDARTNAPVIRVAMPLDKAEKQKLSGLLVSKLGLEAGTDIKEEVDEKLIAGVIFQVGTLMMDGSFSNAVKEAATKAKEKLRS